VPGIAGQARDQAGAEGNAHLQRLLSASADQNGDELHRQRHRHRPWVDAMDGIDEQLSQTGVGQHACRQPGQNQQGHRQRGPAFGGAGGFGGRGKRLIHGAL
jgi:hypothetical protein